METAWQDCQCQCDAGVIGNRSAAQVLQESGVLDAVTYYDSKGEIINAFEDDNVRGRKEAAFCVVICFWFLVFWVLVS